jgi:putative zinc finger/helix-turn-helix YgiT family protein
VLERGSGIVAVRLPLCGVEATVAAPVARCAACGEGHLEGEVLARAHLAIGCGLADGGVGSGDALRHLRKALGLRAADLARLLGVTPETISHWETGKLAPSRAAFVAVAAMADEAAAGRTATHDRLALLAEGRPHPRALALPPLAAARRRARRRAASR